MLVNLGKILKILSGEDLEFNLSNLHHKKGRIKREIQQKKNMGKENKKDQIKLWRECMRNEIPAIVFKR